MFYVGVRNCKTRLRRFNLEVVGLRTFEASPPGIQNSASQFQGCLTNVLYAEHAASSALLRPGVLGFEVSGLGSVVWGLGFEVAGLGFVVLGSTLVRKSTKLHGFKKC